MNLNVLANIVHQAKHQVVAGYQHWRAAQAQQGRATGANSLRKHEARKIAGGKQF